MNILGQGNLEVSFLNIGQGDSTLIKTSGGQTILIDAGPPKGSVLSEIGSSLPFYKKRIDMVIATHPDADHIGGMSDVINRYKPKIILVSGVHADTWIDQLLQKSIKKNNVQEILALKGSVIKFVSNKTSSKLEIIFPDRDVSSWVKKTNDASIVARLSYASTSFMFTGDSPQSIEKYLLRDSLTTQTDVLKVGHHGSKTSTSDEFLKTLKPTYAVISVGKKNRYKHPHHEVIEVLKKNKIKILETSKGRVKIKSNGKDIFLID